jgi:photosystem II stability/assembly factor-like uncharacterized protein
MKKMLINTIALLLLFAGNLFAQGGWTTLTTGTSKIIYDMSFPPGQNSVGYGGAMQGTYNGEGAVIKTTDGGDTWSEILGGAGTDGIEAVCFTSADTGFIAGWNNYFAKTTDGGASWTTMTVGSGNWYFMDIEFWDADNGIAVSKLNAGGSAVYVTDDGGATWSTASGITHGVEDAAYATATTLFAVGVDEKISKSTDGGSTWSLIYTGTFQSYFFGVDFDGDFGVVGGEDGKIMHTTDGGSSWITNIEGYDNFKGASVYDSDSAYVAGSQEDIYKTTDGGANWAIEDNGSGSATLYKVKFNDIGAGYVCGSQGVIKRREAPLSADFEADQTTICAGSSVNYTDLSTSATSWSWVFEGGTPATSTDQNPTVTYNTAGDYDVELTASNASGSDTETKLEYISVLLTPDQANEPEGDSAVCTNKSYSYTTDEVDYAEEYDWDLSPANAGTLTGNGTTATLQTADDWSGDFTIKVRATNICGIGDWSDELEGTLTEGPEIFNLSEGGEYCDGEQGIEITQDGSTEGVDYELFLEEVTTGVIIAGTGSEISYGFFTEEGGYNATASNGSCNEDMAGIAMITVNLPPDPADTPEGDTSVCAATTTDYSVLPIEGADSIFWTLTPDNAGNIIGNGENISVEWDDDYEGTAQLSAQGKNDCGFGDESEALEIKCSQTPVPEISGSDVVCKEEETDYSTEENAESTYEWTVSGGEITMGEGTHQITVLWGAPGNGTIDLTETVAGTCSATAETLEVTIDDCVGFEDREANKLTIYPNPATNRVNIQSASLMRSVRVYDFTGKEILSENIHAVTYQINTSRLNSGIYLMVIETEEVIINKRIIIE